MLGWKRVIQFCTPMLSPKFLQIIRNHYHKFEALELTLQDTRMIDKTTVWLTPVQPILFQHPNMINDFKFMLLGYSLIEILRM